MYWWVEESLGATVQTYVFPVPESFDGVPIVDTALSDPLDAESVAVVGTQLVVESVVKSEDTM